MLIFRSVRHIFLENAPPLGPLIRSRTSRERDVSMMRGLSNHLKIAWESNNTQSWHPKQAFSKGSFNWMNQIFLNVKWLEITISIHLKRVV